MAGQFRKRLSRAVAEAGDAGASAVYLPVRPINGVTIPASLIESEIEDTEREDPAVMIAGIISDPATGGEQRIVDGARAARTDTVTTKVTPKGDWPEVTTRQIVYTIETPHRRGRWVVLSFSAVSGDNPSAALSDALVLLFDALMTTFRWAAVPGGEISTLEARLRDISATHPGSDLHQ
ncbi:MAG: hypothetical protein JWQ43_1472 [Glaciihabitans sp.]|nr:hypothetical protein [Glaciihabitans sp.]